MIELQNLSRDWYNYFQMYRYNVTKQNDYITIEKLLEVLFMFK